MVEVPAVNLPRTGTDADEIGVTTVSASSAWDLQNAGPFNKLGIWSNAVSQGAASDGQSEQSLRVAMFVDGPWLAMWFGLRAEGRSGYDHDPVMRLVADWEEGLSIIGGARILPWLVFETGMNLDSDGRYGRIGVVTGDGLGTLVGDSSHLSGGHVGMLLTDSSI